MEVKIKMNMQMTMEMALERSLPGCVVIGRASAHLVMVGVTIQRETVTRVEVIIWLQGEEAETVRPMLSA